MISDEDVKQGFRAFLGREPESEATLAIYRACPSQVEFARLLATSAEFRQRTGLADGPTAATVASIYPLLYGRALEPSEANRLRFHGIQDGALTSQMIRRVIGATDRQASPTPYLVRFGAEDITYVRLEGFELAVDIADVAVGSIINDQKKYEPHLTSFFQRTLKPGMSVVDVGANIGYYTMLAAGLVGKHGSVTAFEPNSENARLVLLSIERNGFRHVQLIPVALSTRTGNAFFSPHMGSNGGLLPSSEESLSSPQCVVVPTVRMDDIVKTHVDFIKVDTEGAEGLILEGATGIIERDRPVVSSEFSPEMLSRVSGVNPLEFLLSFKRRGYRVMLLDRLSGASGETEVHDPEAFMSDYGNSTRIEEIVFAP